VLPLALVRTLIPFLSALLTLRFRTAESSAAGVAARLLEIGALLALLDEGLTLASVALALTGGAVVHLALLFWSTRSEFHGPRAPAALRPALVFGGVFWLNSVADYFLGRQGDVLLLGALLHPGKGPASLYDVAYTMVQTVSLAATVGFSGVALSGFSRAASGAGDPPRLYATVLRVATGLSIPLLSYVLWNAGTLIAVLYGPAFSAAAPLLMAMASFRIVARAFGGGENTDLLLAHGQVAPVVRAGLVAAGVNVALDFALIPSWGAAGAVVASGCAGIFVLAVTAHLLRRGALGAPAFAFWLRVTVPALLIGRLSALVPPGSTVYSHSAHALAYAAVTFAFFMFIPILPYTDRISIRAAAVRLLARVRS
jgi:O-antigen/teichoic acid export membrane protein